MLSYAIIELRDSAMIWSHTWSVFNVHDFLPSSAFASLY